MDTISLNENFCTSFYNDLDEFHTRLVNLSKSMKDVIVHTKNVPDYLINFYGEILNIINTFGFPKYSFKRAIQDAKARSNTVPVYPNASVPSTVANTNASTTPTFAGGTPNAKNNNSAFLWALAAIGGIGLFAALNTGKRK